MEYNFANRMGNLQASAIREILKFTSDPTVISFAAGNPAPTAFPTKEWSEISQRIFAQNPINALQYSISEGYTPLRDTLKKYLKENLSIGNESDELIITSGAQQAIELACKVMCNENDTIICENPSFIGSLNAFKSYKANLVGIDVEDDGINTDKLEEALKTNKNVKLIYLIPNFQNPTGICMSLEKRKKCYELAKEYNCIILEDNPYGDLRFSGSDIPTIKSFDTTGNVIYCGSFSKVLSPGMRVGYTMANKEIIQKIVVVKQVSDVHTNILSQMVCDIFMNEYDFKGHIAKLKEIYKQKATLFCDNLDKHLNKNFTYIKPQGGLFVWVKIPDNIDMMTFCSELVQKKVAVVPGQAFMPNDECKTNSVRLNYSTPTDEQIIKGIEILGQYSNDIMK